MSDYDLSGLSDAERAALEEDGDDLDQDLDPVAADDGDADNNDADDGGDASGDQDATADAGDAPQEDGTGAGEADAAAPSFRVPTGDLGAITQAITELVASKEELESAYEAGDSELTYAEHRAKLREIDAALLDLNAERAEVQAIQRMNAAYQQEWWNREIKSFKREALKEGVDYDQDRKLEAEWDKAVRYLGADPENADKDAAWFLKEAHEMVKARFKLGRPPEVPTAQSRMSKVDEALAARRTRAGQPPRSLSQLPQAGIEAEGQSEFSHLDGLNGLALEQAVARMTPEQQARWEAEQ